MHIHDFPDTTLLVIFSFLCEADLCRVARTCRGWRAIAYDSSLWRCVNLKRFHKLNEFSLIKLIRNRMVPMLFKINLGGFTLSPRVFQVLAMHCKQLRVLCLGSVSFEEDFTVSDESFPGNLTKLDIRHSSGHPTAFKVITQNVQQVQCLGLSDSIFGVIDTEGEKLRFFASLKEVRILEFSYCNSLTDTIVQFIAENCPNLRSLCLRRCHNIRGESLSELIDCCSSLTSLVLDGTSVSDNEVQAVSWENSMITEVDLSWCRHLSKVGLKSILTRCHLLRFVRLCCCGYGHAITDEVLHAMTESRYRSLQVLDLSYSSEVTNCALGRFVASCSSLQYLRVYHCQKITSTLVNLIPSASNVFVVANFQLQRGGLATSATSEGPSTLLSATPVNYSRRESLDMSLRQD